MNVATLELSKELYELSGWGEKLGESDFYAVNKKGKQITLVRQGQVIGKLPLDEWHKSIPAYDLGFLLRKMPEITVVVKLRNSKRYSAHQADFDKDGKSLRFVADNPEDAAAKLAIDLFKANILVKETL